MELKFTNPQVKNAPAGRHTFAGHPGLILSVGTTSRTFYLKKQEPKTKATKSIKLGRWIEREFTHEDAADMARKLHAQIERDGAYIEDKPLADDPATIPTFGNMFERYCENVQERGKAKEKTVHDYRGQVRRNLADFAKLDMDQFTPGMLQDRLDQIAEGSLSSAHACRRIVGAVFNYARRFHPSLVNPVGGTKGERGSLVDVKALPRRKPRGELVDFWSDIQSLTDPDRYIGGRHHNHVVLQGAYLFGLFTGIRSINVRYLEWDQVDLDAKTVELLALKNGVDRIMPLSDYVVDMLHAYQRQPTIQHGQAVDVSDLVFPSPHGSKDGAWSDKFPRLDNGTFHDCRKHFSDAAMRARLHRHEWKFLRGDKLGEEMMDAYVNSGVGPELPNMVAAEILNTVGEKPALKVVA